MGFVITTVLVIFAFAFLLQEGQGALEIVQPYPKNVYPIEGTDVDVTCVAYDVDNKTSPAHITFVRQGGYGDYTNVTGPRVTFTYRTELGGRKLLTTMHIKNAMEEDHDKKGKYECWVFEKDKDVNTAGHGFSVIVILTKYIPAIKVTADVIANPEDKVSLTCNVTLGAVGLTKLKEITWTKDDALLERVRNPDIDDPLATLSPFTIDSIKPEDGGTYTCRLLVQLQGTTDYNITGSVSVSVKPSFIGDISNQEVKSLKGEDAKFKCAAVGFPLQVEWKRQTKSEKQLQCINGTEDRYDITRKDVNSPYVLTIEDLLYEDRGKYFCCFPSNCSDETEGCQEWTLRVRDPLGPLWPFIGIIVEAIILFLIIFIAGKMKQRKEKAQKDDRVEFSYSSTDEGDRGNVRLRKMETVNA